MMLRSRSLLLALAVAALAAPATAQATRDSVVCTACVPVVTPKPDSTIARVDTTWNHFTRPDTTYRDSVVKVPVVTPPDTTPLPPPVGAHEPAGGTVVADNDWSGFTTTYPPVGKTLANWYRYHAGTTGRWVSDPSAPLDPDVLEVFFSGKQGVGPEHLSVSLPKGSRQLYISVPLYVPPGYVGSSSGVQKLFHIWAPSDKAPGGVGGSMAVPAIFGVLQNRLTSQIRIQGATVTAAHLTSFNIGGKPWERGRWYVTEWLFVMNSPGQADGEAYLWQDGVLAAHRTGITYSKAGLPWTVVQLNPTYGGTGTVPQGTRLRYGRIRVVAAP